MRSRCDPGTRLEVGRGGESRAIGPEGDQEPWGKGCAGARHRREQGGIGMRRKALRDGLVELGEARPKGQQLADEDLNVERTGGKNGGVLRQRGGRGDLGHSRGDQRHTAAVVLGIELPNRGGPCTLQDLQRGPPLQEFAGKRRGQIVAGPAQRLREILRERRLQLQCQLRAQVHRRATELDESRQGPGGRIVRVPRGAGARGA